MVCQQPRDQQRHQAAPPRLGFCTELAAHPAFIAEIVGRHNARHRARIDAERAVLGPLPSRRAQDFELERVQVTSHSGFTLRKVFYSVPSGLIGHTLRVHLYAERAAVFGRYPALRNAA